MESAALIRLLRAESGHSQAAQIDIEANGRILEEVLDLAEQLPSRRRPDQLQFPPLRVRM